MIHALYVYMNPKRVLGMLVHTGLWTSSPKMMDKFKLWCEEHPAEDEFFHAPGASTVLVRKDMASGRVQPLAMSSLATDAQRLVSLF